jgi:hypothetical protein
MYVEGWRNSSRYQSIKVSSHECMWKGGGIAPSVLNVGSKWREWRRYLIKPCNNISLPVKAGNVSKNVVTKNQRFNMTHAIVKFYISSVLSPDDVVRSPSFPCHSQCSLSICSPLRRQVIDMSIFVAEDCVFFRWKRWYQLLSQSNTKERNWPLSSLLVSRLRMSVAIFPLLRMP